MGVVNSSHWHNFFTVAIHTCPGRCKKCVKASSVMKYQIWSVTLFHSVDVLFWTCMGVLWNKQDRERAEFSLTSALGNTHTLLLLRNNSAISYKSIFKILPFSTFWSTCLVRSFTFFFSFYPNVHCQWLLMLRTIWSLWHSIRQTATKRIRPLPLKAKSRSTESVLQMRQDHWWKSPWLCFDQFIIDLLIISPHNSNYA